VLVGASVVAQMVALAVALVAALLVAEQAVVGLVSAVPLHIPFLHDDNTNPSLVVAMLPCRLCNQIADVGTAVL